MWARTFRALTTNVSLEVHGDRFVRVMDALTRTYGPAAGPADLRFRIESAPYMRVYCDDELDYGTETAIDLPPAFELGLYSRVMASYRGCLLHAAAVATPAGAIVVAGESGAGKTTLALALLARGGRYISEECVGLDASGVVAGLARPINVLPDDIASVRGFDTHDYEIRSRSGAIRRHALVLPAPERIHAGACPLSLLIRLRYEPDEPTRMVRLSSSRGLSELWTCRMRAGADALAAATRALGRFPVYELRASSVAGALEAIDRATIGDAAD